MLRRSYRSVKNVAMTSKPPKDPLLVVIGATGTGKSKLAVELAAQFNGEIINGDAMQMYDGLPIITNKVTADEQRGIPHHLLGFISLHEEPWRVSLFKKRAGEIIKQIRSRGRLPIVVGGTHYYTQSLLFGDSLVQEELGEEDQTGSLSNLEISRRFPILDGPTEAMIERLKEVDPMMVERWHPNDRRKIRRSLEIYLLTGKKASDIYEEQKQNKSYYKTNTVAVESSLPQSSLENGSPLLFWVHSEPEILKRRLDGRVDKMMETGLLDEVKAMDDFLLQQTNVGVTVDRSRGIWVSIGWKEFEQYLAALRNGTVSQDELATLYSVSVEKVKSATRQYARRQTRWIRLKLMPALANENVFDRLYLLDGSDIAQWTPAVCNPAIDITEEFLRGGKLCSPSEISDAANEFLAPQRSLELAHNKDLLIRRECETCNTILTTEDQWQRHLKSRGHRRLLKKSHKAGASCRSFSQHSDTSTLETDYG